MLSSEDPNDEVPVIDSENERIRLSDQERLQLEEQIRKFVQLLTQSYLLSCGESKLDFIKESSKQILMELSGIALENNIFKVHNLSGSLSIIKEVENNKEINSKLKCPKGISHTVRNIIFHSKVFMYPELLPSRGFIGQYQRQKVAFSKAEDNLIALGLERFSTSFAPIHNIQNHLLPSKTARQIRFRIKNLRASKAPKDNPIKYYYTHKEAPPMSKSVQLFDPHTVRAPKDNRSADMPEWIRSLFPNPKYRTIAAKIVPKPVKIFYKPHFILPKGVPTQNDDAIHSIIDAFYNNDSDIYNKKTEIKKAKKNNINSTYKLPFILPKSKVFVRKYKELNRCVSNQLGMESDTNSNTKCELTPDYLLKKSITKSLNISDNEKDKSNNTYDSVKTLDKVIDKPLDVLSNKSSDCSNIEVIIENDETPDKSMIGDLVMLDSKYSENSSTEDVEEDKIQSKVTVRSFEMINNKISGKSNDEHVIKAYDALGELEANPVVVIDNKNNGNIKSKGKCKKGCLLNKVVMKSLFSVDDKNCENKKFNSNSSVNLNGDKCFKVFTREESCDASNINHPKKQKISKTVDFFPDPDGKDCGVIIKSEIIDESDESVQDAFIMDCTVPVTLDSSVYAVNKTDMVQTYRRNFEMCKINHNCCEADEHQSSFSDNEKTDDFKNTKVMNENITFTKNPDEKNLHEIIEEKKYGLLNDVCIDDAILKCLSVTPSSNKCSNFETRTYKFTKIQRNRLRKSKSSDITKDNISYLKEPHNSFSVEQKIRNDSSNMQSSKYVHDMNSNKCGYESYTASNSDRPNQDADDLTCLYKNKINIDKTFCETLEKNTLCPTSNNVFSKSIEFIPDLSGKSCDVVIKSEVVEENSDSSQDACLRDCETTKLPNSSLLNVCNNKYNSNGVEIDIESKDTDNTTALSKITELIQPQYVYHIKQEIKDDFEISETCEYAHNMNTNKCDEYIQSVNKGKPAVDVIKCTLNSGQIIKAIDFLPDSNDKESGIIIKSEIIEENNDLKDACKDDFDIEKTLLVGSSSTSKIYNSPSRKRNVRSVKQFNTTKRPKILLQNFDTVTGSHNSLQTKQQHESYSIQKFESNDEISKTVFTRNKSMNKSGIPIKSKIIHASDIIFNKPDLRTRRNVIKSNSLEKAHLKRSSKVVIQKTIKQKHQSKKTVRKKS